MSNVLHSSDSNEWYTPAKYIESARRTMGVIELDPASCATANKLVKATDYYTQEDDGLRQSWHGNIWLNPPYGRGLDNKSNQDLWSKKLIDEYEYGDVEQAVLLINAVPDRNWFHRLWSYPLCFTYQRIRFIDEYGNPGPSPTHGNAFVYFGEDVDAFAREFDQYGRVTVPVGDLSASVVLSSGFGAFLGQFIEDQV